MKHHHYDIIQAYYSDPDKWYIFVFSGTAWMSIIHSLWEPTISYKLVLKEKKKTVPTRRWICKIGTGFFVKNCTNKQWKWQSDVNFVRWLDDDWIEYDVDVDGENEVVSMARGS